MVSLIILGENRIFRECLKYWLSHGLNANVLADVQFEHELTTLKELADAKLIIWGFTQPEAEGFEIVAKIVQQYPQLNVLAIASFVNTKLYHAIVGAGIKGCVLQSAGKKELEDAIKEVSCGKLWFSNEMLYKAMTTLEEKQKISKEIDLTERELEILKLICQGFTTGQISQQVFLSYDTVKWHRGNILAKTGCVNSVSLLKYAMVHQIIKMQELEIWD